MCTEDPEPGTVTKNRTSVARAWSKGKKLCSIAFRIRSCYWSYGGNPCDRMGPDKRPGLKRAKGS